MHIERRKFLTMACKACMLGGAGILIADFSACTPAAKITHLPIAENTVRIPISSFATESLQIIQPEGWYYNIAIRKLGTDQYEAVLLQCTHQHNQLLVNSDRYTCALHGSEFSLDGQVRKGPA